MEFDTVDTPVEDLEETNDVEADETRSKKCRSMKHRPTTDADDTTEETK